MNMNPETEFAELVDRTKRMFSAALLLIITFALLVVSGVTLLFTVFVTVFSMARNGLNKITERATVERGVTFRRTLSGKAVSG